MQTPAGFFPKSNVHAVPEGATVHQSDTEVRVIGADGTVIQSIPFTAAKAAAVPSNTTSLSRRDLQMGYVAFADWQNTGPSPIAFFGTNWHVPPLPSRYDGQLLYWFNGLVPGDLGGILQPVLQYGFSPAGGGQFYAIASWWLIGNDVFHTGITQVSPGTFLQGQMRLTGTSTSGGVTTYNYSSTFVGVPASTITASTTGVLSWAYEAFEIYTTPSTANLPPDNTVFSSIRINFQNGQSPTTIPWEAFSDPADGITMQVLDTTGTNGAMLLTY